MTYRQNKENKPRRTAGTREKERAEKRIESALTRNDEMSFYPEGEKKTETMSSYVYDDVRFDAGPGKEKVKISDDFTERNYEDAYHRSASRPRRGGKGG